MFILYVVRRVECKNYRLVVTGLIKSLVFCMGSIVIFEHVFFLGHPPGLYSEAHPRPLFSFDSPVPQSSWSATYRLNKTASFYTCFIRENW